MVYNLEEKRPNVIFQPAQRLGVLDKAADKGMTDFFRALQCLKRTSFYISAVVEQFFLERDVQRKASKKEKG